MNENNKFEVENQNKGIDSAVFCQDDIVAKIYEDEMVAIDTMTGDSL